MARIFVAFSRLILALFAILGIALSPAYADPPPLSAYGDLPDIEEMSLSPDGKRLAIAARVKGERLLTALELGGGILMTLKLGDTKLRDLGWVGNDHVLLVNSNTQNLGIGFTANKAELWGALVIPTDGSKADMVFGKEARLADAVFGFHGLRKVDGKWTGFFGGLEYTRSPGSNRYVFDHGRPALFAVDLIKNDSQKMARAASDNYWRDWIVDEKGQVAATLNLSQSTGKWDIRNANDDVIASGVDPTGDLGFVGLGQTGRSVIYSLEDDESGETNWYDVPLAGGQAKEILADVDIERLYFDRETGWLIGYLEKGSPPKPVMYDPAHQKAVAMILAAFPDLNPRLMAWTPGFAQALVRTSGNKDSGSWLLIDLAARKADPVGYERLAIEPKDVGAISTVQYRASDGLDMDGVLTLPPGREAKNLPVIMLPHGGPYAHDDPVFDWWAQAFASRGYAVFQPNFRGSTGRGDTFRRAGFGEWGRKMQTDISDGLAALVNKGLVDPNRACIMGASYGGYAALAGVTLQQGLYRCAVAVAPVSDLRDYYTTEYRESGRSKMTRRALAESLGDTSPKYLDPVSPRKNAERADAPIMLIHGKDDVVVLYNQSTRMASKLKAAGKPYELVELRDEDHWLSRAETRKQMLENAMRFVMQHNPPD